MVANVIRHFQSYGRISVIQTARRKKMLKFWITSISQANTPNRTAQFVYRVCLSTFLLYVSFACRAAYSRENKLMCLNSLRLLFKVIREQILIYHFDYIGGQYCTFFTNGSLLHTYFTKWFNFNRKKACRKERHAES